MDSFKIKTMKRSVLFNIVCVILTLMACNKEQGEGDGKQDFCRSKAWYKTVAKSANEDSLVMELSNQFIPNTSLQAYKDHNEIIAFAIDEVISLQKTPSGLFYKIIEPGTEERLDWGQRVRAKYKGYFLDGKIFDTSCKRGGTMEFFIGNMIRGWNEGLQLIGEGGKIMLIIPSRLAYESEGLSANGKEIIPPDEVLLFEIEVENIVD